MNSEKIAVKKYLQSTGLCGPASLKILLSHFGKDFSESDLAGLASAAAGLERGMGTEHEGMINAAKDRRICFCQRRGTVEELEYFVVKEKLPVIIAGLTRDVITAWW